MKEIRVSPIWIENRIKEIDDTIRRLEVEREILKDWRRNPPSEAIEASRAGPELTTKDAATINAELRGMSPSDAIDALLADRPGMTRKQVVDRLEPLVDSKAQNVRAVLNTAIHRKQKAGDLHSEPGGRLYLAKR